MSREIVSVVVEEAGKERLAVMMERHLPGAEVEEPLEPQETSARLRERQLAQPVLGRSW